MMDKNEIIERLREIAKHAVYTIDEEPFIMSLDDGIAVYEAIEIIQQSQPERPKGKWIPQDHNKSNGFATTLVYYFPKCSECGHSGDSAFTFCPWCGADMRGEQDG